MEQFRGHEGFMKGTLCPDRNPEGSVRTTGWYGRRASTTAVGWAVGHPFAEISWISPGVVEPVTTRSPVVSDTATLLGWRTVA